MKKLTKYQKHCLIRRMIDKVVPYTQQQVVRHSSKLIKLDDLKK